MYSSTSGTRARNAATAAASTSITAVTGDASTALMFITLACVGTLPRRTTKVTVTPPGALLGEACRRRMRTGRRPAFVQAPVVRSVMLTA